MGVLEADTIKQDMKEKKLKKIISGKQESYSKQIYIEGTSPKG